MTINVTDQGPSDATNASFVVVAPTSTTFGTVPSPCTQLTPTTIRCTLASQTVSAAATTVTSSVRPSCPPTARTSQAGGAPASPRMRYTVS